MTTVKARFDGRVFVPETPVDLPVGYTLEIPINSPADGQESGKAALVELLEALNEYPDNPDWPTDGAAQHEHYLYGTPKQP